MLGEATVCKMLSPQLLAMPPRLEKWQARSPMPYQELLPHPALRPFVDRLWMRTSSGGEEAVRILPDGCIDVLVSGQDAFVVGTMTRAFVLPEGTPMRTVAVRFRPGGATPFLRAPAHELTDHRVDCKDLGARWLACGALLDADELTVSLRLLERALLDQLPRVDAPNPLVAHAVRVLNASMEPSITQLARSLGFTRQHLSREFRAHVGVSPKELSMVMRMQRAVACIQRGHTTLAAVAAHAGYFDEAHMDRDFRQLVGATPKAALASGSIRPILSLFDAP